MLAARRARREALTEAIASLKEEFKLSNYTDIDARTRDLLVMKLERLRDSQDTKSESE